MRGRRRLSPRSGFVQQRRQLGRTKAALRSDFARRLWRTLGITTYSTRDREIEMTESEQQDQLMLEIERLRQQQEEAVAYERFKIKQQVALRRRHLLTAASLVAVSGLALNFWFEVESPFRSSVIRALALLAPAIGVVAAAFAYLQPSSTARSNSNAEESFARTRYYLDRKLAELRESLGSTDQLEPKFTEADKARVLSSIQAKLESEALQSYVAGIQELIATNLRRESVEQLFRSISERLGREVQDQAKRGNLNLILGILTTLIGLTVLGYSVFYAPVTQSPSEILAYFVPRVSLVVLIEVFAYFFLRLYKQSLSEIKYFQNEITNIESRQLAIQFAAKPTEADLRLKIVEELMKTERNFLISKDQTTVDLERDRLSRTTYAEVLGAVKELVKRKE